VHRLFEILNAFITDDVMVIADIGDSLFGAVDLKMHQRTGFLIPAYYTSMGFAVLASISAQLGRPNRRPLVLVGDGAFQITGMELSTSSRFGLNPIVIVLNNHGYGMERQLHEGSFNDIGEWHYKSPAGGFRHREWFCCPHRGRIECGAQGRSGEHRKFYYH